MADNTRDVNRRKVLKTGGAALTTLGIAGCAGGGGEGGENGGGEETTEGGGGMTEATTTSGEMSLEEQAREEGELQILMLIDKPDVLDTILPEFYKEYPWAEGKVSVTSTGNTTKRLSQLLQAGEMPYSYVQLDIIGGRAILNQFGDDFQPINEETAPEAVSMAEEMGYSDEFLLEKQYPGYGIPIAPLYNTDLNPEGAGDPMAGPLDGFDDLADDRWHIDNESGGVSMEAPRFLGSGAELFGTLHPIWGEEKWTNVMEGFAANNPRLTESSSRAYVMMTQGETGLNTGLINDYVSTKQKPEDEQPPVDIQWLEPYLMSANLSAFPTDAPNPAFGRLWLEWIISEAGQRSIGMTGRNPVSSDVASQIELFEGIIPSEVSFKPIAYNNEDFLKNSEEWSQRFEDFGL